MSCLSRDELPTAEQQAALESLNAATDRRYASLFVSWLSPVSSGHAPVSSEMSHPSRALAAGDSHIPTSHSEDASMVEKQLKPLIDHPPLQVCYPGHRPYMYRATGNRRVEFYVECSACMVRGQRAVTADLAATAWARRFVEPIRGIANHATVAA